MSDLMRDTFGLRVEEMMQIINLVTVDGKFERGPGYDRSWTNTLHGVPLMVRYFHEYFEGYKVQYCLSGHLWRLGFFTSMAQPRGHFLGEPSAHVYFEHLMPRPTGTSGGRFVFYVRRWGDEGRYKHDMTLLRMFLPEPEGYVV